MLMLYPAALLKLLLSSNSFLKESLEYSVNHIMSSANSDSFTSFPIGMPFISLPSLVALARTSSIILSESLKSGRLVLVPVLKERLAASHC